LTSPFGDTTEGFYTGEFAVTFAINGQSVDTSKVYDTKDDILQAIAMEPSSVNPVLKTTIVITLDPTFPYTLAAEDFTVNATSVFNTDYVRYLSVMSVDDDAKTLTCKFGGAESLTNEFTMSIRHSVYGLIDTSLIPLDVSASVTSIEPKIGSIYGGTLITITGENFGDEYTDNPV
jgi:hypothetical protein